MALRELARKGAGLVARVDSQPALQTFARAMTAKVNQVTGAPMELYEKRKVRTPASLPSSRRGKPYFQPSARPDSARRGLDVMVHISAAPSWTVTQMMLPSAVNGTLLSMGLAYVILVFAASNWFAAAMAIFNIGMIVTVIFGFIQMSGWGLGPIESILCVLVVGFSVDYTVHLTDSYMGSKRANRAPDDGPGAINDERRAPATLTPT